MARRSFLTALATKQAQMRQRLTGSSERKRKSNECPICFYIHDKEVPDSCWNQGLSSKSEYIQREFEIYITKNKKGRIS